MHWWTCVLNAESDFTNLLVWTSKQNFELSSNRIEQYKQDLTKILSSFEESLVKSESTGVVASAEDGFNCNSLKNIGEKI